MTEANSINAATIGILGNTGTSFTGTPVTQYNILTGSSTTSTLNNIAPSASSGIPLISQGSSSQPVFGTMVVAGGGTGNTSQTAYSLVCGGTTTTGAFQAVADVAVNQMLKSSGTSALPAFSAYPQISGIGIGASPGSTAGITFDGSNFMNNYAVGTWTPTIDGAVSGTTTYTTQLGNYIRIGRLVMIWFDIVITAATGTGTMRLGGLPFNTAAGVTTVTGSCAVSGASYAWSKTTLAGIEFTANANASFFTFINQKSSSALSTCAIANTTISFLGNAMYQA